MLKDFNRRLFFRRSTVYFLVFFLFACCQIILRACLFLTDDAGSRRKRVGAYSAASISNVTLKLVRLLPDGGFESCPDAPSTECDQYHLDESLDKSVVCPILASYYAYDRFRSNRLEDVVFITIHVYLILVTIYAVARESVPHIVFIFTANCLSAIWALARLVMTIHSKKILIRLVEKAGCTSPGHSEADFFGDNFFGYRHKFEGLLAGVSVLSVATEAYVAYKLGRMYTERPWRVVQVSSEIRGMYRLLLGFSVVMQMTRLILPTTMGLWVDRLINTYFSQIVGNHRFIYGPVCVFITCVLPLWAALGWFALRREWKRLTAVFLGLGVILLCCVLAALGSAMFIWTLTTWRLFFTFYILTVILIIATIVLAALCRNNFDKNLDHYLMVQNRLAGLGFAHDHFEEDRELDKGKIPRMWDPGLDGKSSDAGSSDYGSDAEMHPSHR